MRALTMRSIVAGHWKLTTTVERITEADPLKSTQEVAQEISVDHLMVVWHLRQIGNVKKLDKWADCKLKKSSFWSAIFSYSMQEQRTFSQLDCDMWQKVDFIQQPAMISSVVGPRSFKALPKAKPAPKEDQSYCLVVCWPSDHKFCESRQNHYIWEVCSSNQWNALKTAVPAAGIGQQKGPNSSLQQCPTVCHKTNTSKVEQIGLRSFASSTIFIWPLTNHLPFLQASQQLYAGKTHNQQEAENAFKVYWILKHGFLWYKNKQSYFSLAKMCWLQWFLFW